MSAAWRRVRKTQALTAVSDDVARFVRTALGSGRLGGDAKALAGRLVRELESGFAVYLPINATGPLDDFVVRQRADDDPVLVLVCSSCRRSQSDVEVDDTLGTLVRVAAAHLEVCTA